MLGYGNVAIRYPHEMARTLLASNYTTGIIGKNHFGWDHWRNASDGGEGFNHGFESLEIYDGLGTGLPDSDEFDNYDQWFQTQLPGVSPIPNGTDWNSWRATVWPWATALHPTEWTGTRAISWLTNYTRSGETRPFFLKVSFHRPHSPYDPPAAFMNASLASGCLPQYETGTWDANFTGYASAPPGCGPSDPDAWCGAMPQPDLNYTRHGYLASLAFVDSWIGNVLSALNASGLLEDTYVIFTSDHGDGQGEHFHWRKGFPWELSAQVPLVVRWPANDPRTKAFRVPRGARVDGPVTELRDIFPTTMAIAGVWNESVPAAWNVSGRPLTDLLVDPSGASVGWRQYLDLEHALVYNETVVWSALTDGKIKYIFHAFWPGEQLFNLTADPRELHDQSTNPAYQSTLLLWRQRLVAQYEQEQRGPQWVQNGVLQPRRALLLYSPYYPQPPPPVPGDSVFNFLCGDGEPGMPDNASQLLQFTPRNATDNSTGTFRLIAYPSLCLAATYPASALLSVLDCASAPADQITWTHAQQYAPLVHTASGLCANFSSPEQYDGEPMQLVPCQTPAPASQVWCLGLSGRLFPNSESSRCATAVNVGWAAKNPNAASFGIHSRDIQSLIPLQPTSGTFPTSIF